MGVGRAIWTQEDAEEAEQEERELKDAPMSKSGVALTIDYIPCVAPAIVHSLNETAQQPGNQATTNTGMLGCVV